MTNCLFVADLHGDPDRFKKLFKAISSCRPSAVFLGGDLLPSPWKKDAFVSGRDFLEEIIVGGFNRLRDTLGRNYPKVFLILGNDDPRVEEVRIVEAEKTGIWIYLHNKKDSVHGFPVYGYSYVPPTPFMMKDWERYDVSRYTDPGCISPEEGWCSVPISPRERRYQTIEHDLNELTGTDDLSNAILLFHTPPYKSNLDRVAVDGKLIDYVPLDPHVGSIAVRRFIEARRPLITLHGHIHESARLSGSWQDRLGTTYSLSAAYDGNELALVRFSPESPAGATRELL